ncbi:F0F1 ATP synthase subunit delta [Microbacterium awajiense]|uniref:ATP synthase subunit delta n=1 Tax=Microbacterium awajiense TaxID=415214 RepID=A0ABP7AF67_9MICO
MGSATTQARNALTAALDAATGVDLGVATELFGAARALDGSPQLAAALADSSADADIRFTVVADVFGPVFRPVTVELVTAAVGRRWSSASDLVEGLEEAAVRAAAIARPDADLERELFQFSRTIAANPELELALGSRLGRAQAKGELVETLLTGQVSDAAVLIASATIQQPRERRVRDLLDRAIRIVADQRSEIVATVVSATPLSTAQQERLITSLSARYGTRVALNLVVDPSVVGGLRVQIADDVIDASVASRIHDLRQRLAG